MLKKLNEINKPLKILSIDSPLFREYGQLLTSYDFNDMFETSENAVDLTGPSYIRDLDALHRCPSFSILQDDIFGETEIEAGLCFGMNDRMNGMEYHKGSEVIIAVTDVVLILGHIGEIDNNKWNSSLARCFYVPKGQAVELYGGTLHLAPCRVNSQPFCTVIVLPDGTNSPLINKNPPKESLLFMKNKWLICHKESPAVQKGAYVGIEGDNIRINTL